MPKRMIGSRFRPAISSALIAGLVLLAGAPFWHGGHEVPLLRAPALHADHPAECTVDGGHAPASHPAHSCLICLSQRLLGQSWIQAEAGIATPHAEPHESFVASTRPETGVSLSPAARAPPLH